MSAYDKFAEINDITYIDRMEYECVGYIVNGELHYLPGKSEADLPRSYAWVLDGFAR